MSIGAHTFKASLVSVASITTNAINTQSAGSTFVVFVAYTTGPTSLTITDNATGNSYTSLATAVDSGVGYSAQPFKAVNANGKSGHTFTVTFNGGNAIGTIWVVELIGVSTSPVDQVPAGNFDNASPYTSNTSGTTTQASEVALAMCATGTASGTETITWGGSQVFTTIDEQGDTNGATGATAFLNLSATGTVQSSFTASGGGTADAISFVATFKFVGEPSSLFFGAGTTS